MTSEHLVSERAEMPEPQQPIGLDSSFCLQAGGLRAEERPLHSLQLGDEGSGLGEALGVWTVPWLDVKKSSLGSLHRWTPLRNITRPSTDSGSKEQNLAQLVFR